jgi:hypothetical protein
MSKYVENDVNADHERLFVSIATFLNLTCPVNYEPNLKAKTCPKIPPSQIPTRNAKKETGIKCNSSPKSQSNPENPYHPDSTGS